MLLWYAPPVGMETVHAEFRGELVRFERAAKADGIRFRSITYQDLVARLRAVTSSHDEYFQYLVERYFPNLRTVM